MVRMLSIKLSTREVAQWPIGYGVGLRIKRSSVRIRPWPLRWVLGQGSLLPLSQGEAFTLASISYLAILVKYILAKKKKKKKMNSNLPSSGRLPSFLLFFFLLLAFRNRRAVIQPAYFFMLWGQILIVKWHHNVHHSPAPGMIASLVSVRPMRAFPLATRKSHDIAISKPPPRATPSTAAITGIGSLENEDKSARARATAGPTSDSAMVRRSLRSAPAQKNPGTKLRSTTTRTLRSCSTDRRASSSWTRRNTNFNQ